jgi:hypothetical protein
MEMQESGEDTETQQSGEDTEMRESGENKDESIVEKMEQAAQRAKEEVGQSADED